MQSISLECSEVIKVTAPEVHQENKDNMAYNLPEVDFVPE